MEITKTAQIYDNIDEKSNLQQKIQGLGSIFSQSKKIDINHSLFNNKINATSRKKTKRRRNKINNSNNQKSRKFLGIF